MPKTIRKLRSSNRKCKIFKYVGVNRVNVKEIHCYQIRPIH